MREVTPELGVMWGAGGVPGELEAAPQSLARSANTEAAQGAAWHIGGRGPCSSGGI